MNNLLLRRRALMGMLGEKGDPFNGHEYVDLGLPSGTLWAKCNVMAETPSDDGLFYTWGDVDGFLISQGGHTQDNYKYYENGAYTKYHEGVDNLIELELADDMARVNMGGLWRVPSIDQIIELFENTDYEYITNYNSSNRTVCVLTSVINGNTVIIPLSGHNTAYANGQNDFFFIQSRTVFNNGDYYRYGRGSNQNKPYTSTNGSRYTAIPVRGIIER